MPPVSAKGAGRLKKSVSFAEDVVEQLDGRFVSPEDRIEIFEKFAQDDAPIDADSEKRGIFAWFADKQRGEGEVPRARGTYPGRAIDRFFNVESDAKSAYRDLNIERQLWMNPFMKWGVREEWNMARGYGQAGYPGRIPLYDRIFGRVPALSEDLDMTFSYLPFGLYVRLRNADDYIKWVYAPTRFTKPTMREVGPMNSLALYQEWQTGYPYSYHGAVDFGRLGVQNAIHPIRLLAPQMFSEVTGYNKYVASKPDMREFQQEIGAALLGWELAQHRELLRRYPSRSRTIFTDQESERYATEDFAKNLIRAAQNSYAMAMAPSSRSGVVNLRESLPRALLEILLAYASASREYSDDDEYVHAGSIARIAPRAAKILARASEYYGRLTTVGSAVPAMQLFDSYIYGPLEDISGEFLGSSHKERADRRQEVLNDLKDNYEAWMTDLVGKYRKITKYGDGEIPDYVHPWALMEGYYGRVPAGLRMSSRAQAISDYQSLLDFDGTAPVTPSYTEAIRGLRKRFDPSRDTIPPVLLKEDREMERAVLGLASVRNGWIGQFKKKVSPFLSQFMLRKTGYDAGFGGLREAGEWLSDIVWAATTGEGRRLELAPDFSGNPLALTRGNVRDPGQKRPEGWEASLSYGDLDLSTDIRQRNAFALSARAEQMARQRSGGVSSEAASSGVGETLPPPPPGHSISPGPPPVRWLSEPSGSGGGGRPSVHPPEPPIQSQDRAANVPQPDTGSVVRIDSPTMELSSPAEQEHYARADGSMIGGTPGGLRGVSGIHGAPTPPSPPRFKTRPGFDTRPAAVAGYRADIANYMREERSASMVHSRRAVLEAGQAPRYVSFPGADQPAEPVAPAGADQPAEPVAPAGPDQPAEPAGPDQPAEPAGADEPAEPAGADQPAEPAGADQPAEPAGADQPAEPAAPAGPNQPAEPAGAAPAGGDRPLPPEPVRDVRTRPTYEDLGGGRLYLQVPQGVLEGAYHTDARDALALDTLGEYILGKHAARDFDAAEKARKNYISGLRELFKQQNVKLTGQQEKVFNAFEKKMGWPHYSPVVLATKLNPPIQDTMQMNDFLTRSKNRYLASMVDANPNYFDRLIRQILALYRGTRNLSVEEQFRRQYNYDQLLQHQKAPEQSSFSVSMREDDVNRSMRALNGHMEPEALTSGLSPSNETEDVDGVEMMLRGARGAGGIEIPVRVPRSVYERLHQAAVKDQSMTFATDDNVNSAGNGRKYEPSLREVLNILRPMGFTIIDIERTIPPSMRKRRKADEESVFVEDFGEEQRELRRHMGRIPIDNAGRVPLVPRLPLDRLAPAPEERRPSSARRAAEMGKRGLRTGWNLVTDFARGTISGMTPRSRRAPEKEEKHVRFEDGQKKSDMTPPDSGRSDASTASKVGEFVGGAVKTAAGAALAAGKRVVDAAKDSFKSEEQKEAEAREKRVAGLNADQFRVYMIALKERLRYEIEREKILREQMDELRRQEIEYGNMELLDQTKAARFAPSVFAMAQDIMAELGVGEAVPEDQSASYSVTPDMMHKKVGEALAVIREQLNKSSAQVANLRSELVRRGEEYVVRERQDPTSRTHGFDVTKFVAEALRQSIPTRNTQKRALQSAVTSDVLQIFNSRLAKLGEAQEKAAQDIQTAFGKWSGQMVQQAQMFERALARQASQPGYFYNPYGHRTGDYEQFYRPYGPGLGNYALRKRGRGFFNVSPVATQDTVHSLMASQMSNGGRRAAVKRSRKRGKGPSRRHGAVQRK